MNNVQVKRIQGFRVLTSVLLRNIYLKMVTELFLFVLAKRFVLSKYNSFKQRIDSIYNILFILWLRFVDVTFNHDYYTGRSTQQCAKQCRFTELVDWVLKMQIKIFKRITKQAWELFEDFGSWTLFREFPFLCHADLNLLCLRICRGKLQEVRVRGQVLQPSFESDCTVRHPACSDSIR